MLLIKAFFKLISKHKKRLKVAGIYLALAIISAMIAAFAVDSPNFTVLNPKGTIGAQQKDLLIFASLLSLVVIIPVYLLVFFIAWRYRENNKKARYQPHFKSSRWLETIWWGVPIILISILSVVTWKSSHQLDPFKPIESAKKPVNIQVVALDWKWLFIYPEENIATVNYLEFPVDRPLNFQITGDAPMNSFWIPQLGGQIYAMSGMATQLHLKADESGEFTGRSANISGEGFSKMTFTARAVSDSQFSEWVEQVKLSDKQLMDADYQKLRQPSVAHPKEYYSAAEPDLFNKIIAGYIRP